MHIVLVGKEADNGKIGGLSFDSGPGVSGRAMNRKGDDQMASTFNSATIVGYVGRDPERRSLPGGDPVTDFSVATTERWRTQGGQEREQTTWFRVSCFGRLAAVANDYLHKGSYVYVEGPLTQREWTDREGVRRTTLEVRARELRMLDRAADRQGEPAMATANAPAATSPTPVDKTPF